MERWERAPHRRSRSKSPSFSSSLLDAIYRSIDEEHADSNTSRGAPDLSFPHKKREEPPNIAPSTDYYCHHPKTTPAVDQPSVTDSQRRRSASAGTTFTPTSSSSSSSTTATAATTTSSSAGFSSSSDAESIRSDRIPRPDPQAPEKKTKKKKSKCGSIRGRLRGLRKGRAPEAAATPGPSPASPGARLASFLNALFASAGIPKKGKIIAPAAAAAGGGTGEESACSSSASSCRRSCLSKAPAAADRRRTSGAEAGKRSVRFYPVSVIVDEDSRPCGHKHLQDDAGETAAPVAARVEELLRAAGADVEAEELEEEEEEEGSESSSDLFELENLTVMKGGYRDELPVFETTDLNTNRAIAQGLIL